MTVDAAASAQPRMVLVWPWLLAALAALMIGLLVGPPVPVERQSELCVVNVRIAGPFGVSLNCDSPGFLRFAQDPATLLEPTNMRQSRPGLVLLAAGLSWPLSPLADLTRRAGVSASHPDRDRAYVDNALANGAPSYAVYIGLNAAILLLSFLVFGLTVAPRGSDAANIAIFVSVCFLLAACDPVKAFVWSPHTQMFNIFVPVFAVWASLRASEGALLDRRFALTVGIIAGLGSTAYPFFIVVVPCILVAGLVARFGARARGSLPAMLVNFLLLVVLTMLPETLWYLFVRYKTGGFYQYEIEHDRQVVWMLDVWRQGFGELIALWMSRFLELLSQAKGQIAPVAALLGILGVTLFLNRGAAHAAPIRLLPLTLCCAMVALAGAGFYTSAGNIVWRLAFVMIPPLIVGAGAAVIAIADNLAPQKRWIVAAACMALALAQAIALIVKDGPYS